jgi:BlaR1 peptidase M56
MTGVGALGLGRPAILVSRSVADALSDESLDEIVMHEQAHLDRYDDWSQLLLAIVVSLVGLHPAVRFLARRLDIDREAACDDRVVSSTGATRRYAGSLLAVAAVSNREAAGAELAAGVLTATTTVSALRVRVGRLLDPRRDRSARLASATSLVIMTALAISVVILTQLAPVVIFVEAAGGNALQVPAIAVAPTLAVSRGPEPPRDTSVNSAAGGVDRLPHRTVTLAKRSTRSERLEQAADQSPGTASDAPLTPPDITAADPVAPLVAVPLPSWQPAATASAPTDAAPAWQAVKTSAVDAAGDVARAATATGARARNAGVSIGHFVTRASKAGASVF